MATCSNCNVSFEVATEDLKLLEKISPVLGGKKISIPPPIFCGACRLQHLLMFRNQHNLYKRTCAASKKQIVSIYAPEKPHTVYAATEWWKDNWDAMTHGRDFNPGISFFTQFGDLMKAVPHIAVLVVNSENCDYTNQTYDCRNCYLSSAIKDCEDLLYCHNSNKLTNSTDCAFCANSQLLYQCTDTYDSYNCAFAMRSIQCTDCMFIADCMSCMSCFGCIGLRNKQYHIFNEPFSKEEYEKRKASLALHTYEGMMNAQKEFEKVRLRFPHAFAWLRNCENSAGNYLKNCKNAWQCFDGADLEDCRHSTWIFSSKDSLSCYGMGESQIMYDCVGVEEVQNVAFSFGTSNSHDCYYTDLCFSCDHCFGCVGLRKKQYCILNKQYSKEQYEALVPQIIEKMNATKEWGNFSPPSVSAFAYNESKAQDYFPLTKEEATAKGYGWKDDIDQIPTVQKIIPADRLPGSIQDIPDDILNWAIKSEESGRPFVISKQELAFMRNQRLPMPHLHPMERQKKRMQQRNPMTLWKRKCGKCGKEIQTTYAPERPEIVYCEECYLKTVY